MIEADAGGEMVGLHIDHGTCYGFNATATRVWQLLEEPRTINDLCALLMAEHDVDEAECRADLPAMIEMLVAEKLVALSAA